MPWALTNKDVLITVSLINKGARDARDLKLNLESIRDYVQVKSGEVNIASLSAGELKPAKADFTVFVTGDRIEMARFSLIVEDQQGNKWMENFEIRFRDEVQRIEDFVVADGGIYTVVSGGVDSVTGALGAGNGDGIASPGEWIVLLGQGKWKVPSVLFLFFRSLSKSSR